ncbi:MAG: hypothetical protein ACREJ5_27025 [Geminicoccaceae bacterium]
MSRSSLPNRMVLGAAGLLICLMQPAVAFECPEPQARTGAGVIQESQGEVDRLSALLRTGDLDNRLEVLARDLKAKYANADTTELTNFMVSAYCPVVAEEGLSDGEKDARLTAFGQQVSDFYSKEGL